MDALSKFEWIADLSFKIARHYRSLFNNEPTRESSDAVLHDLAKFCGVYEFQTPQNNEDIAPLELARRAGRLEVYQHIQKYLRMTETQKRNIAMRLYEQEQNQLKQGESFL